MFCIVNAYSNVVFSLRLKKLQYNRQNSIYACFSISALIAINEMNEISHGHLFDKSLLIVNERNLIHVSVRT